MRSAKDDERTSTMTFGTPIGVHVMIRTFVRLGVVLCGFVGVRVLIGRSYWGSGHFGVVLRIVFRRFVDTHVAIA
jgi:hypothetical protein